MRHQQDRASPSTQFREFIQALVRERLVADRQHLIHEQHVRIDVNSHSESETHVHAR